MRYRSLHRFVPLLGAATLAAACSDTTEPTPALDTASLVTTSAKSADAFVQSIGINTHISYFRTTYGTGWSTIIRPRLLALGVRHVRDQGTVTSSDGWMSTVYGRMRELSDSGVKFNLILRLADGSADYASTAHLSRLLSYTGNAVESFEGLNEHDASGHANWVTELRTFQQAAYRYLKSDSRSAGLPVYGPAMAQAIGFSYVGDLSSALDGGAIHPYPGGQRPLNAVATHVTYGRKISGAKPMMATESGYHNALAWTGAHPGVSEAAMGRYAPRLALDYFNAGILRSYQYELIDEGTSTSDREMAFGLLRSDGTPKPAYTSLKNLITLLADPGPAFATSSLSWELSGDTTNVRRLLLQKRNGHFFLVLWHDAFSFNLTTKVTNPPSAKKVTLRLAVRPARIRAYASLTSTAAVTDVSGASSVALTVPDSPLVIEVTP